MAHQAGPGIVSLSDKPHNTLQRITKGGKHLNYELRIIQQPAQARACGAGAKASADRRPVDPAPILQLQVFEDLANGERHDVTFTTHTNYFLFATLERARNIASARNIPDSKYVDLLTGTNVTGMQSFDRPTPAIYFIFPDLSVRHDGWYKLNFSLYEYISRPEDEDRNEVSSLPDHRIVTHRLDVRSAEFQVYSAKRFPGLRRSTSLSRTFAEQGSRIRIRRDVRMRRRDTKGGKDWDEYDEEEGSQVPRLSHTPDHFAQPRQHLEPLQRPRSSNEPSHHHHHHHHLQQIPARRTSMTDFNQQYQIPQASGYSAYPNVYSNPSTTQSYTHPSSLHAPGLSEGGYQTTSNLLSAPPHYQQSHYNYEAQPVMPQLQYPSYSSNSYDNAYGPRGSGDPSALSALSSDSRRASMQSLTSQPVYTPQSAYSQSSLSSFPRQPQQQLMPQVQVHHSSIAPLEPIQPPMRVTTPNPPILSAKTPYRTTLPPLNTSSQQRFDAASPLSAAPTNSFTNTLPTPTDSHKRSYSSTFSTSWQNDANKQGARPEPAPNSMFLTADADSEDTVDQFDERSMRTYRRAGGNTVQRQMP